MDIDSIISKLQQKQAANPNKAMNRLLLLISELESTKAPIHDSERIEQLLTSLPEVQTEKGIKGVSKSLRRAIMKELHYVPHNYYRFLGIAFGLSVGCGLGIALGVPFEGGLVYGPLIGSSLGALLGLWAGRALDRTKARENKVLQYL